MKKLYSFLILLAIAFSINSVKAKTNFLNNPINKSAIGFTENKGQIHDQNFKPNTEVKFLLNTPGMNVQLKANSFSYDTYSVEQKESSSRRKSISKKINLPETENIYHFHRVDVEFINANSNPEIISENPSETYFNYYTTATSEKGVTNARSFSKITYKNLYPNIDLEFVSDNGKLKYNFILHFGADINQIKWQYKGSDNSKLNKQNIEIKVEQGLFTETIPESYLTIASRKLKSTKINFTSFGNNIYGFKCEENFTLRIGQDLIIDPAPSIVWSTYKGGLGDEVLTSTCTDKNGNIFVSGWTSSSSSIATGGAYQVIYGAGNYDGTFMKFNPNGVLKWATYYGGNGDEVASIITIDNSYNLFIGGPTTSTTSISTPTVHQVNYGGGSSDAYLAKFDTNGVRQWCTYYGGNSYDDLGGCSIDKNGNVYISGSSTSTNAISTGGAHQVSFGGGPDDAYLVKFNNNGVRQWGTYYGDTGDDGAVNCAIDIKGNIYMTGFTASSVSISTGGSHQPIYGGGTYDGFLVKFNKNGIRQWGTYYGGNAQDICSWVYYDTLDLNRGLYITGNSPSTSSIASIGAYQTINNGSDDGFLVRFDTIGTRLWGTYLGGPGYDGGFCITSDNASVYVCGLTQSFSSVATPNGMQTTNGGGSGEGFIAKFTKPGIMQWCTYYGGSGYDLCYGTTMDKFGNLIVVGTTSSNGMATAGAHQIAYGGGPHDGYCTKFNQLTATGVNEEISINNSYLNIFPNPSTTVLNISDKQNQFQNSKIEIINSLGQIILSLPFNNEIDISKLSIGLYNLKISTQQQELFISKFIKQ